MMPRTLTGWHVFGIFGVCFGIIIAVNLTLAFQAVSTFPGIVTKNSYVASQRFETERQAQDALGWTLETDVTNGALRVAITDTAGAPVEVSTIKATFGRATHVADDIIPTFVWNRGGYEARIDPVAGYWTLWLEITAQDGTAFRRRIPMTVKADT